MLNLNSILGMCLSLTLFAGCASMPESKKSTQISNSAFNYGIPHVKRSLLMVSDIDRSLIIYRDVLGFEASEIVQTDENSFSYPVFNVPKEGKMRYVFLNEPDETRVLRLTEVTGVDLPSLPNRPYMNTTVIAIDGLEDKFETLKSMGLELTPIKQAKGVDFYFIEQGFIDFDGHLIFCYEILQ
jgi:catechol 2,3-dioxygenase-like lactoylglutathione lyase family enzyme